MCIDEEKEKATKINRFVGFRAKMTNALEVSSDFLMNGTSDDLAGNSLTDKELLNQFKIIEKLPDSDKNVVKVYLDAFITKGKLKQLAL